MRHLKIALTLLFVAAFALAACSGPAATQPASGATEPAAVTEAPVVDPNAPVSGGTIIIGTPQEPGMMNTLLTSSSIEDAVTSLFDEGLVSVNEKGEYVPVLAKELPTVSEDGLVVTWKLKEGIKWSDGSDFNCDDVKFTMDGALSDLSQVSASGYRDIETLECPDPYTVVATFAQVYAPYLRLFSYTVPDTAGALEEMETWDINRNPVGTGPFILSEWVPGDHLTFTKNPYYREEGKPYLDSIIIKILPSREVGMQLLGKLIMTALWTEACLAFPALDAMKEGFEVYVVADAVGGTSKAAHEAALRRIEQAGGKLISKTQLWCELQRDWNREETVPGFMHVFQNWDGSNPEKDFKD